MTDQEPLAQWLISTFARTDDLMAEIARPAYRFIGKNEMLEALEIDANDIFLMAQIARRLQLIASNIDARDKSSGLRLIKNG
jgi:hypothetical protein